MIYFLIALGGALGALSRYGIFQFLTAYKHEYIRLGVFSVNILGSFLIGITLGLMVNGILFEKGKAEHFLFITGFLGAFTTFSTFSQDNVELFFIEKNIEGFLLNISANIIIGFLACTAGYFLVKAFIR